MLAAIYGEVKTNYQLPISTRLEDYKQFPFYSHLHTIFTALQKHRGHQNFVRTPTLPQCDFFVPAPGFIVEFDESQHFTQPRALTLGHYSSELRLGFSLPNWRSLCQRLHARDNDPPFRDEQRAWYDTLRDFLPVIKELRPTVRLYASEERWCSFDPQSPTDRQRFKGIVEQHSSQSRAWIATVVLQSNRRFSNEDRLQLLTNVLQEITTNTEGDGVIIFPAGWFQAGSQEARTLYPWLEEQITLLLRQGQRQLLVCLGVDGRKDVCTRDQVGLALSSDGIIAIGRKFHPTAQERGKIDLAGDPWAPEEEKSRVFTLHGKNYYLAVCYDSFGIRKEAVPAQSIDGVINLVHGFHPKGQGESGDVYFAKHGFAGASKQWGCPVFGAAVFFNRANIENWPSAVSWNQGEKSTQRWQYNDNPLSPRTVQSVAAKEGKVLVRVYDLGEKELPRVEPFEPLESEETVPEKGKERGKNDIAWDTRCEEILRMCQEQDLPLPEGGYELMDASGGVCAEAELAWREKKIAVLLPEQNDSEARFLEQGWAVFSIAMLVDDPSPLRSLLTGNPSQGIFSALWDSLPRVVPFSFLWGKNL